MASVFSDIIYTKRVDADITLMELNGFVRKASMFPNIKHTTKTIIHTDRPKFHIQSAFNARA
jgi:hypothetical protein